MYFYKFKSLSVRFLIFHFSKFFFKTKFKKCKNVASVFYTASWSHWGNCNRFGFLYLPCVNTATWRWLSETCFLPDKWSTISLRLCICGTLFKSGNCRRCLVHVTLSMTTMAVVVLTKPEKGERESPFVVP